MARRDLFLQVAVFGVHATEWGVCRMHHGWCTDGRNGTCDTIPALALLSPVL